jgi:ubiquitin C-terminal hydrolase
MYVAHGRSMTYVLILLPTLPSPTLLESLNDRFSQTELLMRSAGNGWRPEKGAATVDAAYKGTSLIARGLPSILQLHLKRFTTYDDAQMARRIKVNDRLVFPVELNLSSICYDAEIDRVNKVNDWLVFPVELNLSSAETTTTTTTRGSDSTIYDLQSVIVHVGKYGGIGHYYSYIRPDPTSDVWYRFNDDVVEQVTEKEVLQDAYGGRNMINNTGTTAAPTKRGIFSVLARLLRRIGGGIGDPSYGFGGRESNALVVQYVQRSDLHKLYQK